MEKVEINISRLIYLQKLYRLSDDDLVAAISDGLKKPIAKSDIYTKEIKLSYLKKIDNIFNKGIYFYLDPKDLVVSDRDSVFFRKKTFNSDLNIGTKKIVTHFEEAKNSLSAITKLTGFEKTRILPVYKISDSPKITAERIRSILNPSFQKDQKDFLKVLIEKFANHNIYVFEFVETWNKKDKANVDGFYLSPNTIVIKRQSPSYRREIFTLLHELAHYLLDEEEIDALDDKAMAQEHMPPIERWCSDFAFYFLIGKHAAVIDNVLLANHENDYQIELIAELSNKTHLSKLALFTRLLLDKKITTSDYKIIRKDLERRFEVMQEDLQMRREMEKELGIKREGRSPQPIKSPLFIEAIQSAYYEGILSEYEVCQQLHIKPEKLDKYI